MDSAQILEILVSYNRFWMTGKIEAGISSQSILWVNLEEPLFSTIS